MAPAMDNRYKMTLLKNCLVIACRDKKSSPCIRVSKEAHVDGWTLFTGFVRENAQCFWNQCLVQSVSALEYRGYVVPTTLIVSGSEYSLEVIRSAWARRVLRPPPGYELLRLGDITQMEMTRVLQTQFAPLAEALCKAVHDLSSRGETATLDTVTLQLASTFPAIERPGSDVIYRTLGDLIRQRRLYHTGLGYKVAAPDTFLKTSASSQTKQRPMLLTNEEVISRLHPSRDGPSSGESRTSTLERSASMRVLRDKKDKDAELHRLSRSNSVKIVSSQRNRSSDSENRDSSQQLGTCPGTPKRSGVFSRWFRKVRERSNPEITLRRRQQQISTPILHHAPSHASFSTQFPPMDWRDPDFVHYHSRSTQTVDASQTTCYRTVNGHRISYSNRGPSICCECGVDARSSLRSSLRSSQRSNCCNNSRSKTHTCGTDTEGLCCGGISYHRHRSASPPRRRHRKLPPTLPNVSPPTSRKPPTGVYHPAHPRYLPAPPPLAASTSLYQRTPILGLYGRFNGNNLTTGNEEMQKQTERFRQQSSILFQSTDDVSESSPTPPRKANNNNFSLVSSAQTKKTSTLSSSGTTRPTTVAIADTVTLKNLQNTEKSSGNTAPPLIVNDQTTTNTYQKSAPLTTTTKIEEKTVQQVDPKNPHAPSNLKSTLDVNVVTETASGRTVTTNISTSLTTAAPKVNTCTVDPTNKPQAPTVTPVAPPPVVILTTDPCEDLREKDRHNVSDLDMKTTTASDETDGASDTHDAMSDITSTTYPKESPLTRAQLAEAKAAFFGASDVQSKGSADDSGFLSTSPHPYNV